MTEFYFWGSFRNPPKRPQEPTPDLRPLESQGSHWSHYRVSREMSRGLTDGGGLLLGTLAVQRLLRVQMGRCNRLRTDGWRVTEIAAAKGRG
jgi:hypothetical protein